MSILAFPDPAPADSSPRTSTRETAPVPPRSGKFIRRRGSVAQGRALESLGHAVEYLVDSRMFHLEGYDQRDEQEAIQILMRLSRAVFAECPQVISLRSRLRRWVDERLARDPELSAGR